MLILSSARPLSNSEGKAQSQARHRTTKIVPHRRGKNSKTLDRYAARLPSPLSYLPPSFLSVLSHIIYNQEREGVREGGRFRGDGRLSSRRDDDDDAGEVPAW